MGDEWGRYSWNQPRSERVDGRTAQLQRLDSLAGPVIRIDPGSPSFTGGPAGKGDYTVPTDNPYDEDAAANNVDDTPATLGEIWAYGFRNGHRMAWTPDGRPRYHELPRHSWKPPLLFVLVGISVGHAAKARASMERIVFSPAQAIVTLTPTDSLTTCLSYRQMLRMAYSMMASNIQWSTTGSISISPRGALMRALLIIVLLTSFISIADVKFAASNPQPQRIVEYKTVAEVKLTLHIFNPPDHHSSDTRSAIVFFFGGGWQRGSVEQFYPQSAYFASRGMVAICADYRVKSRHHTSPKECVKDGKSALRWIRSHCKQLGIAPNKLVASGGSAGGHVAAAIATTDRFDESGEDRSVSCRPNALVLYNPVFDNGPTGYGHDRVADYWQAFSPLHNIDATTPPTLVFLGTKDHLIPVATAQEYQRRMEAVGGRCDLKLYAGQRHGFFNKSTSQNNYVATTIAADKFLNSIGFLSGQPTLLQSRALPSSKQSGPTDDGTTTSP